VQNFAKFFYEERLPLILVDARMLFSPIIYAVCGKFSSYVYDPCTRKAGPSSNPCTFVREFFTLLSALFNTAASVAPGFYCAGGC
jgi:hypothetical protein